MAKGIKRIKKKKGGGKRETRSSLSISLPLSGKLRDFITRDHSLRQAERGERKEKKGMAFPLKRLSSRAPFRLFLHYSVSELETCTRSSSTLEQSFRAPFDGNIVSSKRD